MEPANYQEHWQRHRRTRNLFWVLFLGLIPALVVLILALGTGFQTITPGLVIAAAWFVVFLFMGNRVSRWRCPTCGRVFAGSWWYNKGFAARKCEHCGLLKYAGTAVIVTLIAAVLLPGAAFGQPSSNQPIRTVRISAGWRMQITHRLPVQL